MSLCTYTVTGRDKAMSVSGKHAVNQNNMVPPFPENMEMAMFGESSLHT